MVHLCPRELVRSRRKMAEPIPFSLPPRDPREALIHRLQNAPQEHAEALLDGYEILQELRDKGLLEIAKGVLGSGDKVLAILTKKLESDEVVRTIRNLAILLKIVGSLDPEMLESIVRSLSVSIADAENKKPPGLFRLLGRLSGSKVRRVLWPVTAGLESLGENLARTDGSRKEPKGKRRKVTRHRA